MTQTVLKNEVTELSPEKGLRLQKIIKLAEESGDIKTADLLTEQLGRYDENAWMLRATIAQ